MGQRGDRLRIRLGRRLHAVLRRAHLGPGVPRQQRQQLVAQAHAFQVQEIPAQVRARVQVHVHRIPRERSHEQAGGTDRQGFTGALERQAVREGLREHPRDLRVGVASGDRLAQEADRRCFLRARVEPERARQQLVLLEQRLDVAQHGRRGEPADVPDGGAHQERRVLAPEPVERAPREHGEDEVVIVERVLRDRHGQQQVQRLGVGDVVPEPEEVVIGGVVQAAIHGGEERLLRGFDAARVHGLGIRQDVRAHVRGD